MFCCSTEALESGNFREKADALHFIQERLGVSENPSANQKDEFETLQAESRDPCVLKSVAGNPKLKNRVQYQIPMSDINPDKIRVLVSEVSAKNQQNPNIAMHSVLLNTYNFERTIKRDLVDAGVVQPVMKSSGVSISIAGDRVAKAFGYLAKLCGAKPRPY